MMQPAHAAALKQGVKLGCASSVLSVGLWLPGQSATGTTVGVTGQQ